MLTKDRTHNQKVTSYKKYFILPCHAFAVALILIVTGANSSLCVLVAVDLLSLGAACPGVLSVFVPAPNASISAVGAGVGCPSIVFALVRIETGFAFMTLQGH